MTSPSETAIFTEHFSSRQEVVKLKWMHAVQASPDFQNSDHLPAPQLLDHLPNLLDDLADCIRHDQDPAVAESNARAHGRHRWEQHFRLDELMRELLLLRNIIREEVDLYQATAPRPMSEAVEREAREHVEDFFDEAVVLSTAQFSEQQRAAINEDRQLLASRHEAARQSAEQHEAVASARLRLLRVIAHELRNLLNAASLTAASLPAEKDPAWRDELHRILARNHERMAALVNQLLEVAPLLAGEDGAGCAPLDLEEFGRRQRIVFEQLAAAKGLGFELCIASGLDSPATNEEKLERVLLNLVQNAVKYTDSGRVDVGFAPVAGGGFEITVTDTGPGIPVEHQERIFDEFHRVPGSEAREGSGLGLAIVQEMVTQLDGKIRVESRAGGGSCFRVTLPG